MDNKNVLLHKEADPQSKEKLYGNTMYPPYRLIQRGRSQSDASIQSTPYSLPIHEHKRQSSSSKVPLFSMVKETTQNAC